MFYNYLIFLCIGVYATCKPISNKTQIGIREIQKDFCAIQNELHNHLENSKEERLDIPDHQMSACTKFYLAKYIGLLNRSSMKIRFENVTTYNHMVMKLIELDKNWLPQDKQDQNCKTKRKSNLRLTDCLHKFLMQVLPMSVCHGLTPCPVNILPEHEC